MQIFHAPSPEKQLQYFRSIVPDQDLQTLPEGTVFLSTDVHSDPAIIDYSLHLRDTTSELTRSQYLYEVGIFLGLLESRGASWRNIDEEELRTYREYRTNAPEAKTVSERTWQRCRSIITGFIEFLVVRGYLDAMPYQVIRGNSVLGGRSMNYVTHVRALSIERWKNFLDLGLKKRNGIDSRTELRDVAAATLMLLTGLRIGEASQLLLPEIESAVQDNGQLALEAVTKGGRFRMVTLTPRVLAQIRLYRQLERADIVDRFANKELDEAELFVVTEVANGRIKGEYRGKNQSFKMADMPSKFRRIAVSVVNGRIEPLGLFLSTSSARMLSTGAWHKVFRQANDEVLRAIPGWHPVTPHDLRHTFATVYMGMQIAAQKYRQVGDQPETLTHRLTLDPLGRVQRALGHASVNTTAVYLRSPHDGDHLYSEQLDAWADGEGAE